MSFAITITTTILGVTTLMIGATTEPNAQAMTVYGCIDLPSSNSTSGPALCLDRPDTDNIWKTIYQLNATGSLHWEGTTYVFMNQTVTPYPTPECKKDNQVGTSPTLENMSIPMITKIASDCMNSLFNWNQMHSDNIVISVNDQLGHGYNG